MSEKIKKGSVVSLHYIGKLDNGSEFDNSYTKVTPLKFKVGDNGMIEGFEDAVLGKELNDKFNIKIPKEKAYGDYLKENVQEVPKEQLNLPSDAELGMQIQGTAPDGKTFLCVLKEITETSVFLDLNHPLAGENLNFDIEILSIENNKNK